MKVFLSWSGESSKEFATLLYEWLPSVLQSVRPFMSAENIDKGERWSADIASELEDTHFGVICVTEENINSPWILFEAGALSKSIQKGKVSPLLLNLGPSDLSKSPLLQFQVTLLRKDDVKKLLNSINKAAPEAEQITAEVLQRAFERGWPELEQYARNIEENAEKKQRPSSAAKQTDQQKTLNSLEEILSTTRSLLLKIQSPENIVPRDYIAKIFSEMAVTQNARGFSPTIAADDSTWVHIFSTLKRVKFQVEQISSPALLGPDQQEMLSILKSLIMELESGVGLLRHQLYNKKVNKLSPQSIFDASTLLIS